MSSWPGNAISTDTVSTACAARVTKSTATPKSGGGRSDNGPHPHTERKAGAENPREGGDRGRLAPARCRRRRSPEWLSDRCGLGCRDSRRGGRDVATRQGSHGAARHHLAERERAKVRRPV